MTEKQKRFCDFYIETGNATEAYKKAGYKYSDDNIAGVEGFKLLKHPKIKNFIDERIKIKDKERIASQDEVLEYLSDVMRGKITEECIVVESTGDYMSEAKKIRKEVAPKDRNKAAELLAKRYGLLTENVSLTGEVGVKIVDDIK